MRGKRAKQLRREIYGDKTTSAKGRLYRKAFGKVTADSDRQAYQRSKIGLRPELLYFVSFADIHGEKGKQARGTVLVPAFLQSEAMDKARAIAPPDARHWAVVITQVQNDGPESRDLEKERFYTAEEMREKGYKSGGVEGRKR